MGREARGEWREGGWGFEGLNEKSVLYADMGAVT